MLILIIISSIEPVLTLKKKVSEKMKENKRKEDSIEVNRKITKEVVL